MMKLIFENWRRFTLLTEISLSQAVDRMENSKVLRSFVKSRIWDPETKTLTMDPRAIETTVDRMAVILFKMVPVDLEDNQRGTSLEWILSRGLKDEQISNFVAGWALDHRLGGFDDHLPAETSTVSGYLEFFFQWQDFMEKKDIFSITGLAELIKVVTNAKPKVKEYQEKKQYLDAGEGTEIFRDDNEWAIYVLHNKGAACEHGKGTDWCTAAPGLNYFQEYYRPDDPLFYFEDRKAALVGSKKTNKYQFHFGSEQFMDGYDEQVSSHTFNRLFRLLMDTDAPKKYPILQFKQDEITLQDKSLRMSRKNVARKLDEIVKRLISTAGRIASNRYKMIREVASHSRTSLETLLYIVENLANLADEPLADEPDDKAYREYLSVNIEAIADHLYSNAHHRFAIERPVEFDKIERSLTSFLDLTTDPSARARQNIASSLGRTSDGDYEQTRIRPKVADELIRSLEKDVEDSRWRFSVYDFAFGAAEEHNVTERHDVIAKLEEFGIPPRYDSFNESERHHAYKKWTKTLNTRSKLRDLGRKLAEHPPHVVSHEQFVTLMDIRKRMAEIDSLAEGSYGGTSREEYSWYLRPRFDRLKPLWWLREHDMGVYEFFTPDKLQQLGLSGPVTDKTVNEYFDKLLKLFKTPELIKMLEHTRGQWLKEMRSGGVPAVTGIDWANLPGGG
jgi:hypothetical protein